MRQRLKKAANCDECQTCSYYIHYSKIFFICVCIFAGQTQAAEGRQLCLATQLIDEEQHLPAHDPHPGPPQ